MSEPTDPPRPVDEDPGPEPPARRTRRRKPVGAGIGGVLVGFDYQVFRTGKPPAELVEEAEAPRGLTGEGGAELDILLPDVEPSTGHGDSPVPGRPPRRLPAF